LKGFLSYLLGSITFWIVATILGVGIDLIQKVVN